MTIVFQIHWFFFWFSHLLWAIYQWETFLRTLKIYLEQSTASHQFMHDFVLFSFNVTDLCPHWNFINWTKTTWNHFPQRWKMKSRKGMVNGPTWLYFPKITTARNIILLWRKMNWLPTQIFLLLIKFHDVCIENARISLRTFKESFLQLRNR